MTIEKSLTERLREYMNSDAGKQRWIDESNKLKKLNMVRDRQLLKLYESGKVDQLIESSLNKYYSEEYENRWYSKGIQPPRSLFHFIMLYAKKYGTECTDDEYIKYGNMFTSELFKINNYYIRLDIGQGGEYDIIKK